MDFRPTSGLRYEVKFLLNRAQQLALIEDLRAHLQPDEHGDNGQYLVTSLYYDTADYKAYWDKVDGFNLRRKVRLRAYHDQPVRPETPVFFEIKARVGNRMGKRRLSLPHTAALALAGQTDAAEGPTLPSDTVDKPVFDELSYLFAALHLQAACVVSYQRLAYGAHELYPDLRVTFDTDVRCRCDNLSLLHADAGSMHTLLEPGWSILEVKVNRTVPYWLGELLSRHGCTPRRISKYCASLEHCGAIRRRQHILLASG